MSSGPWSQFCTGASGSGSGSSASSTPAVATSSSAMPKAICDAPGQVWSMKSKKPKGLRSDWAEIVKDRLPKSLTRKRKINDALKDALTKLPRQNACLGNVSLPTIFHSCHNIVSLLFQLLLIVAMLVFQKFCQ